MSDENLQIQKDTPEEINNAIDQILDSQTENPTMNMATITDDNKLNIPDNTVVAQTNNSVVVPAIILKKKPTSWKCDQEDKKISYQVFDSYSRYLRCSKKQKMLWRYSDNYSSKLIGKPYRSINDPLSKFNFN